MMYWDLDGLIVDATYMDEFQVSGRVVNSRVAYGGKVKHTIVLETPITVYGRVADRVIVEHCDVTRIRSNFPETNEELNHGS